MNRQSIVVSYLMLPALHVARVFEEVRGRFWLIDAFYGRGAFLIVNWILFCIPVVIFYFVLLANRRALYLGMVYAGIMILNGFGHNLATLVKGKYFDGYAGGFTGIGLVFAGSALIYSLRRAVKETSRA